VNVQAEGDALVERELRLSRAVQVLNVLALDETVLVVDHGFDDVVPDRLNGTDVNITHVRAEVS
jgi:hypothetical protein